MRALSSPRRSEYHRLPGREASRMVPKEDRPVASAQESKAETAVGRSPGEALLRNPAPGLTPSL